MCYLLVLVCSAVVSLLLHVKRASGVHSTRVLPDAGANALDELGAVRLATAPARGTPILLCTVRAVLALLHSGPKELLVARTR